MRPSKTQGPLRKTLELYTKDLFLAVAVTVLKLVRYDHLYHKWTDIHKARDAAGHPMLHRTDHCNKKQRTIPQMSIVPRLNALNND